MNYDEITKITAERISDYMTEAVNTDSIAVAEMFHNAAWGARTLKSLIPDSLITEWVKITGNTVI